MAQGDDSRHSLLQRQLRRAFPDGAPEALGEFLGSVDEAYRSFDEDRRMLERSLELSAEELVEANRKLTVETQRLEEQNEDLQDVRRMLEAKNAEMEHFTYTVSHDLKSPMFTIQGFLGFLEKDLESGNMERIHRDVSQIRGAISKLQALVDDLLELSRVGRITGDPEPVDLGRLTHDTLEMLRGRTDACTVAVEVAPDLPTVVGDRTRLGQVMQNLIDNALKFLGDQDDPKLEIGTATPDDVEPDWVTIYVRDNGPGIEPSLQSKVFGLFHQLDPHAEGTGLGLALVQRIVEVHNGRLWLESEGLGHGCTFYVALPRGSARGLSVVT